MAPVCAVIELNLNPQPLHTTETQRMGQPAAAILAAIFTGADFYFSTSSELLRQSGDWRSRACAMWETALRWASCQRGFPPHPLSVVPFAIQILVDEG
jgi:hypothetical protein